MKKDQVGGAKRSIAGNTGQQDWEHATLEDLIRSSEALDEAGKKHWLENVPKLDQAQTQELRRILLEEKKTLSQVEAKLAHDKLEENKRFLEELSQFSKSHIPKLYHQAEKKEREQDSRKGEELLSQLDHLNPS